MFLVKKLSIPLRIKEKTLRQLFVHVGFMLNIPILYLDAIGKSSHKKNHLINSIRSSKTKMLYYL